METEQLNPASDDPGESTIDGLGPVSLLWTNPSSYLSATLDELRTEARVQIVYRTAKDLPDHAARPGARRRDEVTDGSWIDPESEIVLVGGWRDPRYLWETYRARQRGATSLILFDTQPKATLQYRVGRHIVGPVLRRIFDGAFVSGPRQVEVARSFGFPDDAVQAGMYTAPLPDPPTQPAEARRGFVLVGRLVPVKGIDLFLEAYRRYRTAVPDPWPATVVGQGPLLEELTVSAPDGVTFTGFCSPEEVLDHLASAGCLVSSSRAEPWGVAIAEGASMNLPLIITTAAGAGDHFVEEGVNGYVVPVDDAEAMARAMTEIATMEPTDRARMGVRSRELAERLTPTTWVRDLRSLIGRIRSPGAGKGATSASRDPS